MNSLGGRRAVGAGAQVDAARAERLLWVLPLLLSALQFYPITRNYFFGDDLFNLYEIVNTGLIEFLVKPYGMHLLAARNLVLATCFRLFGTNPEPYFWLMLLTHLLNVLLLYRILRLFAGAPLACLGATLWGSSPINEGALGWLSVYGQVLASTLILWVFFRLAEAAAGATPSPGAPWRWAALLLLASLSFGTGIGAAMAFPLLAQILLPASPVRRKIVVAFALVALSLPVLYFAAHRAAQLYHSADTSDVDMALIGLEMWQPVALATVRLLAYGVAALLLGPFRYPVPEGPTVYGIGGGALAAGAAAFALASERRRRQLLAALVLALACYGIIAVGRVSFFMAITATRYHYAATIPLCIALVVMLSTFGDRRPLPRAWRAPALGLGLAALVASHLLAGRPIDHHPGARMAAAQAVATIRDQIAAAPQGADVYIANQQFRGVGPVMLKHADLFPGLAAIFAIYFPETTVDGRRVFVVIEDEAALAAARRGRKTRLFTVAPGKRGPAAGPAPQDAG